MVPLDWFHKITFLYEMMVFSLIVDATGHGGCLQLEVNIKRLVAFAVQVFLSQFYKETTIIESRFLDYFLSLLLDLYVLDSELVDMWFGCHMGRFGELKFNSLSASIATSPNTQLGRSQFPMFYYLEDTLFNFEINEQTENTILKLVRLSTRVPVLEGWLISELKIFESLIEFLGTCITSTRSEELFYYIANFAVKFIFELGNTFFKEMYTTLFVNFLTLKLREHAGPFFLNVIMWFNELYIQLFAANFQIDPIICDFTTDFITNEPFMGHIKLMYDSEEGIITILNLIKTILTSKCGMLVHSLFFGGDRKGDFPLPSTHHQFIENLRIRVMKLTSEGGYIEMCEIMKNRLKDIKKGDEDINTAELVDFNKPFTQIISNLFLNFFQNKPRINKLLTQIIILLMEFQCEAVIAAFFTVNGSCLSEFLYNSYLKYDILLQEAKTKRYDTLDSSGDSIHFEYIKPPQGILNTVISSENFMTPLASSKINLGELTTNMFHFKRLYMEIYSVTSLYKLTKRNKPVVSSSNMIFP